jgi:hypothetical protein
MFKLSILGSRGIPAKYGGFETFAQRLALYLTAKGWSITVYCEYNNGDRLFEENWQGIRLVHIPVSGYGAIPSIIFDWKATLHAIKEDNLILILGYNTAIFSILHRLKGQKNIINMDGLEWHRDKWNFYQKAWLYINDWCGCFLGNHLIADHPEIKKHLIARVPSRKITVIPYGEEPIKQADANLLQQYNLVPNEYLLIIARPEPENNILEIVSAFSRKPRGLKLVVLGRYMPEIFKYHQEVLDVASDEVIFTGSIYDKPIVNALRFYTRLYVHGHSVGGTNPSLVESLAASSPVLAHDNLFNRWVAGSGAHYFRNELECIEKFDYLLENTAELQLMKEASFKRYQQDFANQSDLKAYEKLLSTNFQRKQPRLRARGA